MRINPPLLTALLTGLFSLSPVFATETENLGIRVLPAPAKVTIDGEQNDWDLSGGIFCAGDVENQRNQFGTWIHAMYDSENFYLLARWADTTPLNNPGQVEGDYGFSGDCLQFRVIAGAGANGSDQAGRGSHWDCWRGRDGKDAIEVQYGVRFDQGSEKHAKAKGARQSFKVWEDKQGYNQEIAIPWSLLGETGWKPKPGEDIRLTFEPNFTVGVGGRLTNKDNFVPDVAIDRVFTFMSFPIWGIAHFESAGHVAPKAVRLSDRREFPVAMEKGVPAVDWTGLIKQKELAGFKTIAFEMPLDGYISLNIYDGEGVPVRQLLNSAFYSKGKHEVKWDGLSTSNWRTPGEVVSAGTYTCKALVNPGLDLKLVGWAANAGSAPWDGPTGKDNWGGDHGAPVSSANTGNKVLLGWSGAEAGKALLQVDEKGSVQWKNIRQGIAGCDLLAANSKYVFASNQGIPYRLDAATGSYVAWLESTSPDLAVHSLLNDEQKKQIDNQVTAMAANDGTLFLGVAKSDALLLVDAETGKLQKLLKCPSPVAMTAIGGLLYVSSDHNDISILNAESGQLKPFAKIRDVWGLATDGEGNVYAAVRGEQQQVVVFDQSGKKLRTIGKPGGRPNVGKWDPSGMLNARGIAVDASGQLWVMEETFNPKRVSVWDSKTGEFRREFMGSTGYGALGGGICPTDPYIMVGQGCEWRIDPQTGRATVVTVIAPQGMETSRFGLVKDSAGKDHVLLATCPAWAFNVDKIYIYERLGEGNWKLRGQLFYADESGKELPSLAQGQNPDPVKTKTVLWADANDDGKQDANELTSVNGFIRPTGWYLTVGSDFSIYDGHNQYPLKALTTSGAPIWDLNAPVKMPHSGYGSADSKLVLNNGEYNVSNSWFTCSDISTGKVKWKYPDNFVGVHGSHNAGPPEVGLIRGSFFPCAAVKMPEPIGNMWIIATNVGEWHLLTEKGFYLARLFQGDQVKVRFPEKAVPGVLLDDVPCGMGGEDFGGSATLATDGRLYLQAGKTGFWNVRVDNLDQVKELPGDKITIADSELTEARKFKEQALQGNVGIQRLAIKKFTPSFTGNLASDFAGERVVTYQKGEGTLVRSAAAWDDSMLYLAWEVQDGTPWKNGAKTADAMYWGGDTVDFQLAVEPAASADRTEAVKGDLRLSIGNLSGTNTAVIFRKVADDKSHKAMFSSGVIKEYWMDSVVTVENTHIQVTLRPAGYLVEASIPLSALDLKPYDGLKLSGDFGATFGNQAGDRTRLRSYWSNQHTGIVDDVVYELMVEPKNWAEIEFAARP